jgi:hypothetical protein
MVSLEVSLADLFVACADGDEPVAVASLNEDFCELV